MDLYDKIFSESKEKKKLLFFNRYSNDISFCGYVLSYNSQAVQIQHFSKYGKNDGVITLQYSSINYIISEDEYLRSMQYIIENNVILDINKNGVLPLNPNGDWIVETIKEYKNDKSVILDIEIDGKWYMGFVNDIDDQFFSLTELNREGEVLDTTIYKLSDVSNIHINELEGRKRLLLYNWRNSKQG